MSPFDEMPTRPKGSLMSSYVVPLAPRECPSQHFFAHAVSMMNIFFGIKNVETILQQFLHCLFNTKITHYSFGDRRRPIADTAKAACANSKQIIPFVGLCFLDSLVFSPPNPPLSFVLKSSFRKKGGSKGSLNVEFPLRPDFGITRIDGQRMGAGLL